MKVALVSQPLDGQYPPPGNSISILMYEFARHLAKECDVTVFTSCKGSKAGHTVDQGVYYRHLPIAWDRLAERVTRRLAPNSDPLRPYYASVASSPSFAWRVAREVRKRSIDVVHIVNNSQFVPLIRRFNPSTKIVLHMECEWLNQLDLSMLRTRLGQTDLIVGCSDYITDKVKSRFPELKDRCRTVFNGVDIERFVPSDADNDRVSKKTKSVVFVGRVSPEKGVHVLLEAFRTVVDEIPEAKLELVGSIGSVPAEYVMDVSDDQLTRDLAVYSAPGGVRYGEHVSALVEKLGLEDHVEFRGSIPNHDLPRYIAEADLFVFPSVWEEPFGIPPVEAMAAGVPVVGTRSGGIAETVVHEDTGLLVDRGDSVELAQAMVRILGNPELGADMGARGRARAVETFAYPVVAGELMDLYREIA